MSRTRGHRGPRFPNGTPGWWVNRWMTRPQRRECQRVTRLVLGERLDPDAAVWPDDHKPHVYYW
jgi:hypothetical protein